MTANLGNNTSTISTVQPSHKSPVNENHFWTYHNSFSQDMNWPNTSTNRSPLKQKNSSSSLSTSTTTPSATTSTPSTSTKTHRSPSALNTSLPSRLVSYHDWTSYFFKNLYYSGDLNNKHLNNGSIWIMKFYLSGIHVSGIHVSGIQMVVGYSDHHSIPVPVFKWWSEYRTKFSPVFKWHLTNRSFSDQTTFNHPNTRLV